MIRIFTIFSLILSLFFIETALAAEGASGPKKISKVLWYEGHNGLLVAQSSMSDLGGCGKSSLYMLEEKHAYFKEIYSLILAAHISGLPIDLYISGCAESYPRIQHVTSTQ